MKSLRLVLVGFLQLPWLLAAVPQTSPDILVPVKAGVCIDPLNYGSEFHHFMNHFNLFALASVTSEISLYVSGPVAINGLLTASKSIVVNTNQNNEECGTAASIDDLGIYIRYLTGTANTLVSGRVMYQSNQNTGKIYQLDASCPSQLYQEMYSKHAFADVATYTLTIADYLWQYVDTPTHQITDDGKIKKWFHSYDERFWVFGIGVCTGSTCEPTSNGLRSTGNMFLQTDWAGPSSPGYPTDRVLLFNVAVLSNTQFTATANNPSAGLDPCRAVFNIAPSNYNFERATTGNTMFKRAGNGLFGGTILSVWSTLVDASSQGQFAGQVVALAYDNAKTQARIGDFYDAGGECQDRMTCWVPTNMTAPRALYTSYASVTETTTVSTSSIFIVTSSRIVATTDATFTTTLTQFSILTKLEIPSVTITSTVTTTDTYEFVYEKNTTTTMHTPTTIGTSITVPATSLTTTTTTTIVPTSTTTETTSETSFTYTLTETTTTSTTHISTSVLNMHTVTTVSTMT